MEEAKKLTVRLRLDSYRGRVVAALNFDGSSTEQTASLSAGVIGKHAVYFEFLSEDKEESFSFDRFTFDH